MTTHWLRSPGPGTKVLLVLTVVLGAVAVVLHFAGQGDPAASEPGSLRNVVVFATFVSAFATYLTGRRRS
ncbi:MULTISPECIES: hypothetical protein [Kocuria]|uniref:Uncharacterized protein n=1 Tax=Kocuria rosea subsp. polaris TaxID=136273 RepID=A0A0W8I9R2_KOCRO|nr:hypothetical protein [Kocuria polaris]KUG56642.1 hypothetical protein AVL61_06180 [Kocuria polaris]